MRRQLLPCVCHTVPLRPLRTCPLSQSVTNLIPTKRHIFGPTRCLRPGHSIPPPQVLTGSRLGRRKPWKGLINLSSGVFGVEAAEGCCLQGQSSPHDGGDWRQLRDGCWVLLLSSVGLPSPVQAPQPCSRSPSLPNTQGQSCSISTGGIKTTKQPEISLRRRDAKRATVTAV